MIYSTGLELSPSLGEWNLRAISLSEGVPHRYTYTNKYPFIFMNIMLVILKNISIKFQFN